MHNVFTRFSRFCLLAVLLATPAMTGAAETPPAAGPTVVAPPPAPEVKPTPTAVPAPEEKRPAVPSVRIGYVDLARFGAESEAGKAAREKVRKKSESLEKQVNARQKQLEKQKAALQLKLSGLPPKEQEAKAKEFEKKVDEYRNFMQNAEKEMKGLEAELSRQLYQDTVRAATIYGEANGYAAIVTKRDLLFVGGGVKEEDVTTEVLKLLNGAGEKK
jgi:outer membrane protein